ncbi:ABC transporter ATP-binding protein [Paludicola sp. MB14-C6]|uniref:ABC transporter ATP-binding protein n=1 Tax=Paludihabitans sp. MB14-C6 TaxID=3070656 RepID=UPI0027DE0665|nr:ABC transporter ATP-binding protein [Paludicola sp. MB14-C6]WMJ23079.1 ABC transporter ATP-binding protein [Paludicola sp. MB14-C6]
MSILLSTNELYKIYHTNEIEVKAVNNVSIAIEKEKFTILNGRSGSGKTTLINLLGGLDEETSGDVFIDDINITKLNDKQKDKIRREKIGFVFQSVALMSMMTAYENVELSLRIANINSKLRKQRVMDCLRLVGLEKKALHKPTQLSGGEQQRVAIARAIAHKPSIIFADEPTAELDTTTGISIVKLFKDLIRQEGATIVMTTHDPDMMSIADKVYTLQDGEIINE